MPLVLSAAGCASSATEPSGLAGSVVAATAADGTVVDREQATCIIRTAVAIGGGAARSQLAQHPDLRLLHGPSGAAVEQAYEQCTGVSFADAFGTEPHR